MIDYVGLSRLLKITQVVRETMYYRFIFRTTFSHFDGPTKQFAMHENIPSGCNVGLILNHLNPFQGFIVTFLKFTCIS